MSTKPLDTDGRRARGKHPGLVALIVPQERTVLTPMLSDFLALYNYQSIKTSQLSPKHSQGWDRAAKHRGSSQQVSTTQQTKGSKTFFSKQAFSPDQTSQVFFCQVSGLVLSPDTPKEACSTVSLQQSWLSSCPACQRTNDPGSRAEQAPRQQEHGAAGKESKVWDHRSTAPPELLPTATETQTR